MSFTQIPELIAAVSARQKLSSLNWGNKVQALLNALAGYATDITPLSIRQTGDAAAIVSNTTLAAVAGFSIPVTANATYEFRTFLRYNSAAAADLKTGWTFPTGLVIAYAADGIAAGGTAYAWASLNQTNVPTFEGAGVGVTRVAIFEGNITVAATAGTVQLTAAQNTSDASNTVIKDGSSMILWRTS